MKYALKQTDMIARKYKVYKEGEEENDSEDERRDITEVICDNAVLVEKAN